MCYNDDLEGPEFDPNGFNDEDKQVDADESFEKDDHWTNIDEDALA